MTCARGFGDPWYMLEHDTQRNHVAREGPGEAGVVHDELRDVLLTACQEDERVISGPRQRAAFEILEKLAAGGIGQG